MKIYFIHKSHNFFVNSSHNSLSYWRKNALTLTVYTQGSQKCPLSLQIDPFQSCLGEVFSMWLAALDLLLGWEAVLHGWQPHTGWEKGRQRTVLCVHEMEKWSNSSASSFPSSWVLCTPTGKMAQRCSKGAVSKKLSADCHVDSRQRFSKMRGVYRITQLCWLLTRRVLLTQTWLRTVKAPLGQFRGFLLRALPPPH